MNKAKCLPVIDNDSVRWHNAAGFQHRDGERCAVYKKHACIWYTDGDASRFNAPAVVMTAGVMWFEKGLLHRIGGPAVQVHDCAEYWEHGVRL